MYKLSVVVPVYKAEKYLPECLESIRRQTVFDLLELILVDDGSPDSSGQICDEFAANNRNVVVIHKENGGVSAARNDALKAARGEYIGFVDADDTVSDNYFEMHLEEAEQHKADLVFGGFTLVLSNGTERLFLPGFSAGAFFDEKSVKNEYAKKMLIEGQQNGVCTKLFRSRIIQENNISFPEGIKIAEDKIFVLKYLAHCKSAVCSSNKGYFYRDNIQSAMHTDKKMEELLAVYEQEIQAFCNLGLDEKTVKERKAAYLFAEFADFLQRILNISLAKTRKTVKLNLKNTELMEKLDICYDFINSNHGRIYRWLNKGFRCRSVSLILVVLIIQKIIEKRGLKNEHSSV